jgi:hypothetical protein
LNPKNLKIQVFVFNAGEKRQLDSGISGIQKVRTSEKPNPKNLKIQVFVFNADRDIHNSRGD